jgi:hypothetical protein
MEMTSFAMRRSKMKPEATSLPPSERRILHRGVRRFRFRGGEVFSFSAAGVSRSGRGDTEGSQGPAIRPRSGMLPAAGSESTPGLWVFFAAARMFRFEINHRSQSVTNNGCPGQAPNWLDCPPKKCCHQRPQLPQRPLRETPVGRASRMRRYASSSEASKTQSVAPITANPMIATRPATRA